MQLLELLEELDRRKVTNKLSTLFPDTGKYSRDKYPKQIEFFKLGKEYNERAFIAGNRVGKTICAATEMTYHLLGNYPNWWEGKTFDEPAKAWACGDTAKTVRDIIQNELLGPPGDSNGQGTGLIPKASIIRTTSKHGISDAVESVFVKHISGGTSVLQFKSYETGRIAFQGTSQTIIWLDEECGEDIYAECLARTMTTNGIIMLTFTPLNGLTDVVLSFLPDYAPQVQ